MRNGVPLGSSDTTPIDRIHSRRRGLIPRPVSFSYGRVRPINPLLYVHQVLSFLLALISCAKLAPSSIR